MQQALAVLSEIEEKLAEAGNEIKGKLDSWLEGGFEHLGLVQGVEHLLDRIDETKQSADDVRDVISKIGSPRDVILRVTHALSVYVHVYH